MAHVKRKTLAEEIRHIRLACDLVQEEFAKKIGVSRVSISNYETGDSTPALRTWRKIKEFARVNKIDYDGSSYKY